MLSPPVKVSQPRTGARAQSAQSYCTDTRAWDGSQQHRYGCGMWRRRQGSAYDIALPQKKNCPDSRAATPEGQYQPRQPDTARLQQTARFYINPARPHHTATDKTPASRPLSEIVVLRLNGQHMRVCACVRVINLPSPKREQLGCGHQPPQTRHLRHRSVPAPWSTLGLHR